eukprot:TRINITY_DN2812_c0_g1_i1.p1 TRINITY_DN2812_c0_g1~~TRINITY_DN2812_c0_g1_i1.p1  ORF type:complete len:556 (+),score=67.35 TRINITY_DN2812_c0_g1_i1:229-1668(+)
MVLQRAPSAAMVWGFAPPGTTIETDFNQGQYKRKAVAGPDGIWRQTLLPNAAGGPYTLNFTASSGETASLSDVLFGDVYLCGGQSNMQFSVGGNENRDHYIQEADSYPNIRLFTVGQKTSSKTPLLNLQTIEQPWSRATSKSISDRTVFNYFSAVCWFFGKHVYDGLDGKVPIGLISNNWGGTQVEAWMSPETSMPCGHRSAGNLYNAMIHPYTVGPMALTGFTWYQGESDLGGDPSKPYPNNNYTCTQAAQIQQWRKEFNVPTAFYGVVQLSTWHCDPMLLAELRDQQLATGTLISNFAYATNADHGSGGNIHPPYKQYPGARLANAALAMVYKHDINWRSPTYSSAVVSGEGEVTVTLNDVTDAGLTLKEPFNARAERGCAALNAKTPRTCAYAELQFDDDAKSWVNATVSIGTAKSTLVLRAPAPAGSRTVLSTRYGWGAVPMLIAYRADMDGEDAQLPVLPWSRTISDSPSEIVV